MAAASASVASLGPAPTLLAPIALEVALMPVLAWAVGRVGGVSVGAL